MKTRKLEILAQGRYCRLVRRRGWEFVMRERLSGIVAIVALTPRGELVLTEQWREPVNGRVIELPAGLAGDKPGARREDFAEAARRELLEETGFAARSFRKLTAGPPSCGITSEVITFYRASGLRKAGTGGGDEHEDIATHLVPLKKIDQWLKKMQKKGFWVDPKVYSGLYFLERERSNT